MTIHIIEPSETLEFEVTTSEFLNIFDNEQALIVVIGNKYNYRASAGSSIEPPEPFTVFEVRNPNNDALMFSFKNGMGKQTELSQMGEVVAVSSIVNPVTVNPVKVANFPAEQLVRVVNPGDVNIENFNAVFPEVQKVELTNPVDVQKVQVTNVPDVQKVEVVKEGNATMNKLNDIVFDGSVKAFLANNNRKGVVLVAPSTNTAPVMVQSLFAIEPGGYATLPETAAITVSGQVGDTIKASEAFYPVEFVISNLTRVSGGSSSSVGLIEPNEVGTVLTAFYLSKADGLDTHVKKGGVVDGSTLYETWINFQGIRSIGEVPASEVKDDMSQAIADAMGDPLPGKWRCLSYRVDGIGRFGGMARSFGQFQRIE